MGSFFLILIFICLAALVLIFAIRWGNNNKPESVGEKSKNYKFWRFLTLLFSSFSLLPIFFLIKSDLIDIKNYALAIAGALGLASFLSAKDIIKIPFFKTIFSAILSFAVIGFVVWGFFYLYFFERDFLYQIFPSLANI